MLLAFTQRHFPIDASVPFLVWFQRLLFHNHAVDMFFALSGFLITGILLNTRESPNYFRNFYMRRILRILPIYYAVLILCHLNPVFIYPRGNAFFARSEIWYWAYMMNNHLALNLQAVPIDPATGHFWSLCVEEQYYLFWPLVVFFCGRRTLMAVCAGVAAVSVTARCLMASHGFSLMAVYLFTPSRLDGLALGSLLAVLTRCEACLAMVRRLARPVFFLALAVILLQTFFGPRELGKDQFSVIFGIFVYSLFSLGGIATVATLPRPGLISAFFSIKPLVILGKYSYGFYIYQGLLKNWLDGLTAEITGWRIVAWLDQLGGWSISSILLRFLLRFAIVLGLAFLSWNFFEKDFLVLKKNFEYDAPGMDRRRIPQREVLE